MKTHLDLFSGIGGFALAAKWAGFETVAFCEIEDYPRKVLEKNFPGIPIHRDVREIDGNDYRNTALITGGYPCQPFSLAGQRGGEEDDRHLWPEMFRIIKQARPAWVVAENVAGHITMGLDQVLSDLESEGYACRPVIIPACAVDAPHRRDRVWIVANSVESGVGPHARTHGGTEEKCQELQPENRQSLSDDTHQIREVMAYSPHSNDRGSNTGEGERQEQEPGNGGSQSDVPNDTRELCNWTVPVTEQAGRGESTDGSRREFERGLGGNYHGLRTGMDGYKPDWSGGWEDGVPRVATGIPNRVARLKALGNAIVPQVAYEILRLL